MDRNERRKVNRLARKYGISREAAAAIFESCGKDTKRAGEEIRIQLIFNLLEGEKHAR